MLTRPDLKDEKIIACLHENYGLDVAEITFLPLGADFNTAVYRVTATDKIDYFLKLRSGDFCEPSVLVPHHLKQIGMQNVIPPIATKKDKCWTNLDAFNVALYPYIDGRNAVDNKLSEQQWQQFGAAIKKLHTADIPQHIKSGLPKEKFSSKWCDIVSSFIKRAEDEKFDDSISSQTALFLRSKSDLILNLIQHVIEIRSTLQNGSFDYVVCHADIHGWNLLIDQDNHLYLIDWDTLILAPKERDLMFIGAGIWNSGYTAIQEESLFYKTYGDTKINHDAIRYYRLERIIEDIGEYCNHIFSSREHLDDRRQSLEYIKANFLPNSTIERACKKPAAKSVSTKNHDICEEYKSSEELGLPIFYHQYPEYFDTPSDIYHNTEKNTVIEQLLKTYGVKTVLDMTCGTGSQVFYLTKLGYEVIGSDFSPGLLKIARDKASQQNMDIQFIDGDMRTLQAGKFDSVITVDNAVGHLTKSDFGLTVKNIYQNLNDNGLYIFDILNLDAMTDEVVKADNQTMTSKRTATDGTTIYNVRQSRIDRKNGHFVSENNFTLQTRSGERKINNKCTLQIYNMNELKQILSQNGFQVVEQYKADAYTFKKDDSGYSIITVARKKSLG